MKRKSLFSKFLLLICLIILVLFSLALGREYFKKRQINKEVYFLEEEIERLEKDQAEFSELIDYLNTEDFWEKEARLKLGLQKPGETLVVISDDYFKSSSGEDRETKKITEMVIEISNPSKWWNYFFNF